TFWYRPVDGIDLSALAPLSRNVRYFAASSPADLLGDGMTLASLDPSDAHAMPISGTAQIVIERPGELHAIAAWFSAELSDGVTISNSPLSTSRLDRSNALLPLHEPVAVQPGETVVVELTMTP